MKRKEIWKDIEGYENVYQINKKGQIRSLARTGSGVNCSKTKILKKQIDVNGYRVQLLYKNSKGKTVFIHKLLGKAFLPNPENLKCVNHKNGNPSDNRIGNLEWCSKSQDLRHAYKTGLRKAKKGVCLNTGRTHFKKGQTAWNKGTKGICKPNSGSFQKGHISWNKKK